MTIISSMDGNSTPSRKFLNLLKELTKQFKPQVTIQEEMNINRRTISEITKIMWDSNCEVRKKNLEQ